MRSFQFDITGGDATLVPDTVTTPTAVAGDIALEFDAPIFAGSGTIDVVHADGTRISVDINDPSQVSFDGDRLILNLADDLDPESTYAIEVSDGAIVTSGATPVANVTTTEFDTGRVIYVDAGRGANSTRGEGTEEDPYLSLQHASLQADPGDTIYVGPETEPVSATYRIFSQGTSQSEVVIKPIPGTSGEYQFSGLNNWRIDGDASHVVIEGFEFDGNSDIRSVEEILATGYWDQSAQAGMGGIGINIESGEFITVRENYFHDIYQKAVNIEDGRYVKIQDNIIHDIATRSLSGGHGIMRQQESGDFGDDIDGIYRLEISGNLIFNTYQTMPSWVPSKGFLNMVLDEGKPILIDEVPNFENQDQAVLISDNVVAYGQIDGIRIKPTQGIEVVNNTVYATGEHADGITDINTIKSVTSDVFPDGVIQDNLVFTLGTSQAFELNDFLGSSFKDVSGNVAVNGSDNDTTGGVTSFTLTADQVFANAENGDFSVVDPTILTSGAGATAGALDTIATQVESFDVAVAPDNQTLDPIYSTQIILDNIPGLRDGDPSDGTVFTSLGDYRESVLEPDRMAFYFDSIIGAPVQEIVVPEEYSEWYDAQEAAAPGYDLYRSGHTLLSQNQTFGDNDVLIFEIRSPTDFDQMRIVEGYDVDIVLGGDLILDFSNFEGDLADLDTPDIIFGTSVSGVFANVIAVGLPEGTEVSVSEAIVDGLSAVEFSLESAPICFAKGTRILTNSGENPIENIAVGDLIYTIDHGYQPVRWIGFSKRAAIGRNQPVRISQGAMGEGLPRHDIIVSPQHRILIKSKIASRMTGHTEVLVPAKKLTDMHGIDYVYDMALVTYYHLLFDDHEIVLAEGAAAESLLLGPMALLSLDRNAAREIKSLFADAPLAVKGPARFILKDASTRKLTERHRKNAQSLVSA